MTVTSVDSAVLPVSDDEEGAVLTDDAPGARAHPADYLFRPWDRGTGRAHAAGSALLDGVLPSGRRVHVSLPVQQVATVELRLRESARPVVHNAAGPVAAAVAAAVEAAGRPPCEVYLVRSRTMVPAGALGGLAAEAAAAVRAVGSATGAGFDPETVAALLAAAGVPVPSTVFGGFAALDPATGAAHRVWPWWPRFAVVVAQPRDGRRSLPPADPERFEAAYLAADAAFAARDVAGVLAAATAAAGLLAADHQGVAHTLADAAAELGAAGVCAALDGSAALLFDDVDGSGRALAAQAARVLAPVLADRLRVEMSTTLRASVS